MQQIHSDCKFLQAHNIMDYSLLVGIHEIQKSAKRPDLAVIHLPKQSTWVGESAVDAVDDDEQGELEDSGDDIDDDESIPSDMEAEWANLSPAERKQQKKAWKRARKDRNKCVL